MIGQAGWLCAAQRLSGHPAGSSSTARCRATPPTSPSQTRRPRAFWAALAPLSLTPHWALPLRPPPRDLALRLRPARPARLSLTPSSAGRPFSAQPALPHTPWFSANSVTRSRGAPSSNVGFSSGGGTRRRMARRISDVNACSYADIESTERVLALCHMSALRYRDC